MPKHILKNQWISPFTGFAFAVVALSGVLMLFHLHRTIPGLKGMHEWMGLVFVVASLLHLLQHWRAFIQHFKETRVAWGVAAVILSASAAFIILGLLSGMPPGPPPHGRAAVQTSAPSAPEQTLPTAPNQ